MTQATVHNITDGKSTKDVEPVRLVISMNSVLTNDPCALCGGRTDPNGVDLMLADKQALVCRACGFIHARPLAMLLALGAAAAGFAYTHDEHGQASKSMAAHAGDQDSF